MFFKKKITLLLLKCGFKIEKFRSKENILI